MRVRKICLIVLGFLFFTSSANAMCAMLGNIFVTDNVSVLEKYNSKYEKYKGSYGIAFNERKDASIESFCEKISCTKVVTRWSSCGDRIIYKPQMIASKIDNE